MIFQSLIFGKTNLKEKKPNLNSKINEQTFHIQATYHQLIQHSCVSYSSTPNLIQNHENEKKYEKKKV